MDHSQSYVTAQLLARGSDDRARYRRRVDGSAAATKRCDELHDTNAPRYGRRSASLPRMTHEERAMNEFKLLIDGRLVTGAASLDVIDPATEDVIAKAPRAD